MTGQQTKTKKSKSVSRSATRPSVPSAERIAASTEQSVGVTVDELTAIYILDEVKWFGPQKFKELHKRRIDPADVIAHPNRLPSLGKRDDEFNANLRAISKDDVSRCKARAIRQILAGEREQAKILTYRHPSYPANVYESNNPAPVLYVRGAVPVLANRKAVACVGSRRIHPPYSDLHKEFSKTACLANFAIVAGFALGADTIGHEVARDQRGQTICVMPCGLDRPFPPENRSLWNDLLRYSGGVFVSEYAFGTRAASLTLRKRNKLIVAFALGILVSQSSSKGGAMNAYRFALEQHKPVATFSPDDTDDTSGNAEMQIACSNGKAQTGSTVFVLKPDREAYKAWLHHLSSST